MYESNVVVASKPLGWCVCVFLSLIRFRSFASSHFYHSLRSLFTPSLFRTQSLSFSFALFQSYSIVFVHPDFPGTPFIFNEMLALLKPIINNNQSHPFVASLWLVWLACAQIYNMNGNYTRMSVERIRCSVYTQTVLFPVNSKM